MPLAVGFMGVLLIRCKQMPDAPRDTTGIGTKSAGLTPGY
jgi:hypothetical protein